MKYIKNGFKKRVLIHAFIGGLVGYFILHPASVFIVDITASPAHLHWDAFMRALSFQHVYMAAYFTALGAVFGAIIAFNIQKPVKTQEKLRLMSISDELTGLINRRGFYFLSQRSLKIADRTNKSMVLLFADLDNLKYVNDTLGHHEGNIALINAVKILKKTFREADIIARIGGDEFAILLTKTPESNFKAINSRLEKNIETFNSLSNDSYKLSISIGAVKYNPTPPCSIDELLKQADTLMYENKNHKETANLKVCAACNNE